MAQGTEVTIGLDEHGIAGIMGCNFCGGGGAEVEDGSVMVDRRYFSA